MTILVTRPEPDGTALCHALQQQGMAAIAQPLLDIEAGEQLPQLAKMLQTLHSGDYIIAVSARAVEYAHQQLASCGLSWPEGINYVAVGQKTAHSLEQSTLQAVHYPIQSDSEHLLKHPILHSVAGKKILILRGNGGRELIYDTLQQRNAYVEYCETYRRQWLTLDGEQLVLDWRCRNVNTIVITSSEQLQYLTDLIPVQHANWLYSCRLLVPSRRIANRATELGFSLISTVGSAANAALLSTLSDLKHDGTFE